MTQADEDRNRLYEILCELEGRVGTRLLRDCHGSMGWPKRGVYFFFEPGEKRPNGANRIVRVGTHAVSARSKTTLWKRLAQHRGTAMTGGGNHRGSIFRLHVGSALIRRGDCVESPEAAWANGSNAPKEVKEAEHPIEIAVSTYIGAMPFLWIDADDEPGKSSVRSFIERNSVALLSRSSAAGATADPPSASWLGASCLNSNVCRSGLWNVQYTEGTYDPLFLDTLEELANSTPPI